MLSLYINTKSNGWMQAFLEPDASISVEINSPVFDLEAGGGFSEPFNLPVEPNQHLFPTVTNHHGAKIYDLLYHRPFRLECDDYPILYGIIDLDEEVEVEEQDDGTHVIAINLASNNLELSKLLEGVSAQDIPLKDRIPVGTEFHSLDGYIVALEEGQSYDDPTLPRISISIPLPKQVFSLNKYKNTLDGQGEWINSTNVSDPYPIKPYCNVAISIQKREKQEDGSYKTLREYETFDADRQNSGICFYVMYFMECLFAHYDIAWDGTKLSAFEDFNRLAFFTTKCECDAVPTAYELTEEPSLFFPRPDAKREFSKLFQKVEVKVKTLLTGYKYYTNLRANAWTKYANSKNFPDKDAYDILKELQNAFGIRFIYDSEGQHCSAVFVKDIFADKTAVKSAAIIHDVYHSDQNLRGVKMSYGGGDDDTSFNYNPNKDNSNVVIRNGYNAVRGEKGAYDKNTYYDTKTGDMYRIKVDEDAKTEEELYPSLFEVGQFQDASVGDSTDEGKSKEINIGFSPVISNIVEYVDEQDGVETSGMTSRTSSMRSNLKVNTSCKYTVFLDLELSEPSSQQLVQTPVSGRASGNPRTGGADEIKFTGYKCIVEYVARYGYSEDALKRWDEYKRTQSYQNLRTGMSEPLLRYEEDPLSTYDAGFSLGVMRGPGNDAGVDVVQENYDGNGNARWAYTPTNYAFTSDSIDHFGNWFDYNGEGQGGIDPEQRFSLKLMAEKVQHFQGKRVDGNSVLITTPQEAAYWLAYIFPDSNQDLFAFRIKKKTDLSAKGWSVTGLPDYIAVYPVILHNAQDSPMLLNAIKPNGEIFTPSELSAYAQNTSRQGTFWDNESVLIKSAATRKDLADLQALANIYYFPETAEVYTLTDVPPTATTDFYPIDSATAHRGLLHKFNYEYFWFLIHARTVTLETTMTLKELRSLPLLRWHTFGQYTGLIQRIEYTIHNQTGLSHVIITLKYL